MNNIGSPPSAKPAEKTDNGHRHKVDQSRGIGANVGGSLADVSLSDAGNRRLHHRSRGPAVMDGHEPARRAGVFGAVPRWFANRSLRFKVLLPVAIGALVIIALNLVGLTAISSTSSSAQRFYSQAALPLERSAMSATPKAILGLPSGSTSSQRMPPIERPPRAMLRRPTPLW